MNKKILVCDDEIFIHILIEKTLEKYKFEIIRASDGEEAVKMTREARPDLIIMDFSMPRKTGYEAIKDIKADKDCCKIPIIFLTGLNLKPDIREELEKETVFYLVKPFKKSEIIKAIESALEISLTQDNG